MRATHYESAALPTELSRHADLAGHKPPHPDNCATTAPQRKYASAIGLSGAGADYHAGSAPQLTALSARPASLHSQLISEFVARTPGARVKGFAAELRRQADATNEDGGGWEWSDQSLLSAVIPDAYVVDTINDEYRVSAVEVQVTSPLTARKLDLYLGLYWEVDAIDSGHHLGLILVDRGGSVFEVDLVDLAFEYINRPVVVLPRLPGKFLAPLLTAKQGTDARGAA